MLPRSVDAAVTSRTTPKSRQRVPVQGMTVVDRLERIKRLALELSRECGPAATYAANRIERDVTAVLGTLTPKRASTARKRGIQL
jgi:hypothetical protein